MDMEEDWSGACAPIKDAQLDQSLRPEPVKFKVFAMDTDGAPVYTSTCECTLLGHDGQNVPIDLTDNCDGTFTGSFQGPLAPGTYSLSCLLDGQDVANSPVTFVVNKRVDPSKSVAFGPGLTAAGAGSRGQQGDGRFVIHALDADEEAAVDCTCDVQIMGVDGPVPVQMNPSGDGTFLCSYATPLPPGPYGVVIHLDGNPMVGSPFEVVVERGVDASACYAEGNGLTPLGALGVTTGGNTPGSFVIHAFDSNEVAVCGCECVVKVEGPYGTVPVQVRESQTEGVWEAHYTTPLPAGAYTIEVVLDGCMLSQFPLSFKVPKGLSAGQSFAEGPGLTAMGAAGKGKGSTGRIRVHALDEGGDPATAAACRVELKEYSPEGVLDIPVQVSKVEEGLFEASYATPLEPGNYWLSARVGYQGQMVDEHVCNSPFEIIVKKGIDHTTSYAKGQGLVPQGSEMRCCFIYDYKRSEHQSSH